MNLRLGAKLGPYSIESLLGKGGIGEVYTALDPRLLRRVALKVLPAEIQANPQSLERFRREAQSLAALNHPGIVTNDSVVQDAGAHLLTPPPWSWSRAARWSQSSPTARPIARTSRDRHRARRRGKVAAPSWASLPLPPPPPRRTLQGGPRGRPGPPMRCSRVP